MTNKIIEDLKKRFCRKNAQTGEYKPKWFVEDATTYQDIEDFLIKAIEEIEHNKDVAWLEIIDNRIKDAIKVYGQPKNN